MSVQNVLKECKVDGLIVKLPAEELARETYLQVKKKLELIGGKWKGGKIQGFVFEEDPTELLSAIANGEDRNLKKDYQFFATPQKVAGLMMEYLQKALQLESGLHIQGYLKVLEPSAGNGSLINAFHDLTGVFYPVDCYEPMEVNLLKLKKIEGVNVLGDDFVKCDRKDYYDIIIANPPFNKNQDIDHIMKMYEVSKPGGTIVTLSSVSWKLGSQKKQIEFSKWLVDVNADITEIDAGAFKESGTDVKTLLLVIKKESEEKVVEFPSLDNQAEKFVASRQSKNDQLRYSDSELAEFEIIIRNKKTIAIKELEYLQNLILKEGEDTREGHEDLANMIGHQKYYIGKLEAAAQRVIDKNYGVCTKTGKLIDKERLRAVPHTLISHEARKELKPGSVAGIVIEEDEKLGAVVKNSEEPVIERKCRICGCTDNNCLQCIEKTGESCHWVEDDLCSACQPVTADAEVIGNANENLIVKPAFFHSFYNMLDGIDVTLKLHRENGKLTVSLIPETAHVIKALKITGSTEELDEEFFNVITKPLAEAKRLKVTAPIIKQPANNDKVTIDTSSMEKKDKEKAAKKSVKENPKIKQEQRDLFADIV